MHGFCDESDSLSLCIQMMQMEPRLKLNLAELKDLLGLLAVYTHEKFEGPPFYLGPDKNGRKKGEFFYYSLACENHKLKVLKLTVDTEEEIPFTDIPLESINTLLDHLPSFLRAYRNWLEQQEQEAQKPDDRHRLQDHHLSKFYQMPPHYAFHLKRRNELFDSILTSLTC